jgi:hypothetical protein
MNYGKYNPYESGDVKIVSEDDNLKVVKVLSKEAAHYFGGDLYSQNWDDNFSEGDLYFLISTDPDVQEFSIHNRNDQEPSVIRYGYDRNSLKNTDDLKSIFPNSVKLLGPLIRYGKTFEFLKSIYNGYEPRWNENGEDDLIYNINFNKSNPGQSVVEIVIDNEDTFLDIFNIENDDRYEWRYYMSDYGGVNYDYDGSYDAWKDGDFMGWHFNEENKQRVINIVRSYYPTTSPDDDRTIHELLYDKIDENFATSVVDEYVQRWDDCIFDEIRSIINSEFQNPFIKFGIKEKNRNYKYTATVGVLLNWYKQLKIEDLKIEGLLRTLIEKFDKTPSSKIKCLTTGHIHITSDDKIGANNISTLLDSTKINRKTSATLSTSTHTYLIAKNLEQAAHIIKTHREQIFKDWFYDTKNETETSSLKSSLFIPNNNKWGPISHSDGNNSIILSSIQKQQIYVCFNKLQYIISNILYILYKKTGSNINLSTFDSGVVMIDNYKQYFTERVKPEHYLTYTVPVYPANINIRYLEKDETKRKGVIYEKDLENANVNKGYCPGTNKHKANSHDMHSAHSPHLPQRSRSPPRARSHPLPPLPPLRSRSPLQRHHQPPLRSRSPPRARSHPLPPLPPLRSRSPPRGHPQQPLRSRSPPRGHPQQPIRSRSPPQRHHQPPLRSRSPLQRHHQPHLRSRSPPLPIRMGSRERDRY